MAFEDQLDHMYQLIMSWVVVMIMLWNTDQDFIALIYISMFNVLPFCLMCKNSNKTLEFEVIFLLKDTVEV